MPVLPPWWLYLLISILFFFLMTIGIYKRGVETAAYVIKYEADDIHYSENEYNRVIWNIVIAFVLAICALLSAGSGFFVGKNGDQQNSVAVLSGTLGLPSLVVMIIAIWAWRKIHR